MVTLLYYKIGNICFTQEKKEGHFILHIDVSYREATSMFDPPLPGESSCSSQTPLWGVLWWPTQSAQRKKLNIFEWTLLIFDVHAIGRFSARLKITIFADNAHGFTRWSVKMFVNELCLAQSNFQITNQPSNQLTGFYKNICFSILVLRMSNKDILVLII